MKKMKKPKECKHDFQKIQCGAGIITAFDGKYIKGIFPVCDECTKCGFRTNYNQISYD